MTETVLEGCGPDGVHGQRERSRETEREWAAFERRLARAIGRMDIESFLILDLPADAAGGRGYVQFARWAENGAVRGLRVEAMGSGTLASVRPLVPAQERFLRRLGYRTPLGPDHPCQNHWREWPDPAPAHEVAAVAVATLRNVYGALRPGDLRSRYALFGTGATADMGLGLEAIPAERPAAAPVPTAAESERPFDALTREVEAGLRAWFGVRELVTDDDGDYVLPVAGGALVYLRLTDGVPPVAAVSSIIAAGVAPSPALFAALNGVNGRLRFGRAYWANGLLMLATELSGAVLTAAQVGHAATELAHMAAVLDDELAGRFGGHMAPGAGPVLAN